MSRKDQAPKGFGNDRLREQLDALRKAAARPPAPPPPKAPGRKPPPPPAPPGRRRQEVVDDANDDALFLSVMSDVERIREPAPLPPGTSPPLPPEVSEEAETLARLAELVATGEGLDLADTDEYDEGLAQGVDRSLLVSLRRGDFSVQAHLDLHGMLADVAKAALERFLLDSRRQGRRCVLVIHGRGLHSKDQEPVLKAKLGGWLSRGKLARVVLGFSTARPVDGGPGATYVLLRR
jgi:DNA-nicking Smr family endonuclease